MTRIRLLLALVLLAVPALLLTAATTLAPSLFPTLAIAQTAKTGQPAAGDPEADKSSLTRFVENQLSSENRIIRLNNIAGALSSDATIGEITVADRQGVWLRIVNARIVWTRTALLLGRLDIDTLAADRIEVTRKPLPAEGAPAPEAGGFALPKLPVSVSLGALSVPEVDFGETVFGLKSQLAIDGALTLKDGTLDTKLAIKRLDGPGGTLDLTANYGGDPAALDLDLTLAEPKDGVLANLLKIEGRPAVALNVKGAGPVADLTVDMTLDADGTRALTGKVQLADTPAGMSVDTQLTGPVANLVAPTFRDFFGAETNLQAKALMRRGGGMTLEDLTLSSGALSLKASAETAADNFLRRLTVDAGIASADGKPVTLPVPGGATRVGEARLTVDYGNAASDRWDSRLAVKALSTTALDADGVDLTLGGTASGLDRPEARALTFALDGAVTGIATKNPDIRTALGERIDLKSEGAWRAGEPLNLASLGIRANALALDLAGTIAEAAFNGDIAIKAASLAPFADLAGKPLAGALDLKAKGTVKPLSGGFDLTLDGSGTDLVTGTNVLDRLIADRVTLSGRLARGEAGLQATGFRLGNERVTIAADGVYATDKADFRLDVGLADLALLTERAAGRLTVTGTAKGADGKVALDLQAAVPNGSLAGRPLSDAAFAFKGDLLGVDARLGRPYGDGVAGDLTGAARMADQPVSLAAALRVSPEGKRVENLDFTAGAAKLTGTLDQDAKGLFGGTLKLDAPDISTAAALAAMEAKGSASADIALGREGGRQSAVIDATVNGLVIEAAKADRVTLSARLDDLFGVPKADGTLDGAGIVAGGVTVDTLAARAARSGGGDKAATAFEASARLAGDTNVALAGDLAEIDGGYRIGLSRADLSRGKTAAKLKAPADLTVRGSAVSIGNLSLDVGGGTVSARGEAADTFDLSVAIDRLPLAIANTVKPDLAAGGTVTGTARITGPRTAPQVAFDLAGRGLTAKPAADLGLPPADLDAKGTSAGERVDVDARLSAGNAIAVTAKGAVPTGKGALDLDVAIERFPLSTLNRMVKDQAIGGALTGTAKVGGTLADPTVAFSARANGVTAAPIASAGVAPLTVDARGRYGARSVTIEALTVGGPQGLALRASGRLPLSGPGLSVSVAGDVPLELANRALAERGTRVAGRANLSLNIAGSLSKPVISGMVATSNAAVVDPDSNVRLEGIGLMAGIENNRVTISRLNARLATGGTISAGGTISLDAAAAFPADLAITLDRTRYSDGNFLAVTASGRLQVNGPLARDPVISGTIDVDNAEIGIPDNLSGSANLTDVRHVNAPKDVRATLERARINAGGAPVPQARPSVVRLDITVNAPRRIFIRGRGLDAEMGGSLRLTGPVTSVQPVGGFELIRGRLSILGKRITFNEGTVTLTGDLDPYVNLVAQSVSGDTTVIITVTGRASDPKIVFSSQPELPQDEVLARLIFNRGIGELSGFQIAQLAAAVAELSGGQNTSLLGQLRQSTGLDDLDVTTDAKGKAQVRAGRYIRDNVYLGVQAGEGGSSQVTIDLDVTQNLKARGAAGAKGDSSVGLFYEKDY